jgi:tape measure domain-containing protein
MSKINFRIDLIDRATKKLNRFKGNMRRWGSQVKRDFDKLASLPNLIGGAAVVQAGKNIYQLQTKVEAVENKLAAATLSADQFNNSIYFIDELAGRAGKKTIELKDAFAGFSAAALRSNISFEETKKIFEDITKVSTSLKLDTSSLNLTFKAFEQISSKGTVSMEELKRQLSDHLPGALQIAAKSMGMTNKQFRKMIEQGKISSEEFLPKFAKQLRVELAGSFEEAANSTEANMNRIVNALREGFLILGPIVSAGIEKFNKLLEKIHELGEAEGIKRGAYGGALLNAQGYINTAREIEDVEKRREFILEKQQKAQKRMNELYAETADLRKKEGLLGWYHKYNADATERQALGMAQAVQAYEEYLQKIKSVKDLEQGGPKPGGFYDMGPSSVSVKAGGRSSMSARFAAMDVAFAKSLEKRKSLQSGFMEWKVRQGKKEVEREMEMHNLRMEQLDKQQREELAKKKEFAANIENLNQTMINSSINLYKTILQNKIQSQFDKLDMSKEKNRAKQLVSLKFAVAHASAAASIWSSGEHWIAKLAESIAVSSSLFAAHAKAIYDINKYRRGTTSSAGGLAMLGEEGPEMAVLPRGAQVKTAYQTRNLNIGSPNVTFNVSGSDMTPLNARRFADMYIDATRRGYMDKARIYS